MDIGWSISPRRHAVSQGRRIVDRFTLESYDDISLFYSGSFSRAALDHVCNQCPFGVAQVKRFGQIGGYLLKSDSQPAANDLAGLYQFVPVKTACLRDCRGPFALPELTSVKYQIMGTGQIRQ